MGASRNGHLTSTAGSTSLRHGLQNVQQQFNVRETFCYLIRIKKPFSSIEVPVQRVSGVSETP